MSAETLSLIMSKTVWLFDLGKASIGETVRDIVTNDFLHKASLLIPAEFASTKDAAATGYGLYAPGLS